MHEKVLVTGRPGIGKTSVVEAVAREFPDIAGGNLCRIFAEIAETQARLTPENAAAEIDRLILTAWRRKRPLYLELPSDIPYLQVEVTDSLLKLEMVPSEQEG